MKQCYTPKEIGLYVVLPIVVLLILILLYIKANAREIAMNIVKSRIGV